MSENAGLMLVRQALAEDLAGYGDITSELTVPADLRGRAVITARTDLVVCGLDLARTVMREVDSGAVFTAPHPAMEAHAKSPRSSRGVLMPESPQKRE